MAYDDSNLLIRGGDYFGMREKPNLTTIHFLINISFCFATAINNMQLNSYFIQSANSVPFSIIGAWIVSFLLSYSTINPSHCGPQHGWLFDSSGLLPLETTRNHPTRRQNSTRKRGYPPKSEHVLTREKYLRRSRRGGGRVKNDDELSQNGIRR